MLKVYGQTYRVDKKLLRCAATSVFRYLDENFEVNLRFISEAKIKELNRIYRGKNEVTDVLSFKLDHDESGGDVVICYKECIRQAKTWKMHLADAAAFLLVHGILHLADFDHIKTVDRVRMEKAEDAILGKIGTVASR